MYRVTEYCDAADCRCLDRAGVILATVSTLADAVRVAAEEARYDRVEIERVRPVTATY